MALLVRSLSVVFLTILSAVFVAGPAAAATFVVTNAGTSGAGSLAKAIADANLTADPDVIHFDLSGFTPVFTIGGVLPAITQPLTIDGYSQPGATVNNAVGNTNNANLRIEIDASAVPVSAAAINIEGSGPTTIRGIAIKNIPLKTIGIAIDSDDTSRVEGCFIGTGAAGTADTSAGTGIVVRSFASIGGTGLDDRNLMSGNNGAGVQLSGDSISLLGNQMGIDRNGNPVLGNGTGFLVTASTILSSIGGSSSQTGNLITASTNAGIRIGAGATGTFAIGANSIFGNGGIGIDLGADGVTLNDAGDLDTGPNGKQNFPELTFAVVNPGALSLEGFLDSQPGTYRISVYKNAEPHASGFGEGETFLGTFEVEIPEGETRVAFDASVPLGLGENGAFFVSTTAENLSTSATSEFSKTIEAVAGGARLVVSNTNDTGLGSLRQAVETANANAGVSTIVFDIAGDAPHTIVPTSGFVLNNPVIIDGYSQPGSSPNTLEEGTNAVLGAVLDGSQAPGSTKMLLALNGSGSIVRGIGVHSSPGAGIAFGGNDTVLGGRLEGCFVGVDATGAAALGNGIGVVVGSPSKSVVIGGPSPEKRNLVSGNDGPGIRDAGQKTQIVGNLIGSDASGNALLGNGESGVELEGADADVGGSEPAHANRIIGNGGAGILVTDGISNQILINSLTENDGLGIDLLEPETGEPGVTANDAEDADFGANGLQNFPVLAGAGSVDGSTKVEVSIDVPSATDEAPFLVRFYDNESCDDSGHGEGATFLAELEIVVSGDAESVTVELPIDPGEAHILTATATSENGNTSELSECFGDVEAPSVCGDATGDDGISAVDGQRALRAAVGSLSCDACRCDVNLSGSITTTDALLILRVGVGQQVQLACPPCS